MYPQAAPVRPALTAREQEVLHLLAAGCTDREIAQALFISPKTVEKHVASLRAKLAAPSRAAAVATALRDQMLASRPDDVDEERAHPP